MISFEKAVKIAATLHEGQVDLDGKPYLLHPLAVALMGENEEERIAGVLHDVVEDTPCSFDELERMGVNKVIIDTLEILTHDKSMAYEQYLQGVINSGNVTAINDKRNDLLHNISRNDCTTEHKIKIKEKHTKALKLIEKALLV